MKEEILSAIELLQERYNGVVRVLNDTMDSEATDDVRIGIKAGEECACLRTALTALQEQLDRLEGCEYCTGDVDGRFYFIDYGMQLYIDGNNALTMQDTSGDFVDTHINYCPNCGRKLRGGEHE